jgi:hypothetical protein
MTAARAVIVALWRPKRPLSLRHGIAYVDARYLLRIEQRWRLARIPLSAGDQVRGIYLVTGAQHVA